MRFLDRFSKKASKPSLKCSVCFKADGTVSVCRVCGKPFCEDHYEHSHAPQTIPTHVPQAVPKRAAGRSQSDARWERGRHGFKPERTPWEEFSQLYRDVVGARPMFRCPHCGAVSEDREICGNCMQKKA